MAERTDITVRSNGPLRVSGTFAIRDGNGQEFDLSGRTAISLCRCGHSKNKPFCDAVTIRSASIQRSRLRSCHRQSRSPSAHTTIASSIGFCITRRRPVF